MINDAAQALQTFKRQQMATRMRDHSLEFIFQGSHNDGGSRGMIRVPESFTGQDAIVRRIVASNDSTYGAAPNDEA